MDPREHLENQIRLHEGYRAVPYQDTVGVWTVGWGHNLNNPITRTAAAVLFYEDLREAELIASTIGGFHALSPARKNVLINMAYNLGPKLRGFTAMLGAVARGEHDVVAREMIDSRWAAQVGNRATELSEQYRRDRL